MKLANRRRYPFVFVALALAAAAFVELAIPSEQRLTILVTLLGAVGGVCGFLYSAHREETRIFKDLFTAFNERYDRLHDHLQGIQSRARGSELTNEQSAHLVDYFNLCAEEYLFYRGGYIDQDVWKAWCRGMEQYLGDEQVKGLFRKELETGSYYGLTVEEIEKGVR